MMTALLVIETIWLVLLTILVCGLLRSHAEIVRSVEAYGQALSDDGSDASILGLSEAAERPNDALGIAGRSLDGEAVEYPLWATDDRDTVLAFLTTGCQTCQSFWEAFQADDLQLPAETRLIVVAKDRRHESRARLRRLAPIGHDLVLSSNAWTTYHVPASPYFVYITGANAKVAGEGTAETWPQVLSLLEVTREEDALAAEEGLGSREPTPDVAELVENHSVRREPVGKAHQ